MADEFEYDEIKTAIETGNVVKLRDYWYQKVKLVHEKIFNALGRLEPLVIQANIAPQEAALTTLVHSARDVASLDMFVAAASISYTQFSDKVRRAFRIKFKSLDTIKVVSSAFIDIGKGRAGDYELHAKIIALVNEIYALACETANIDCFRLLLNGYLQDLGIENDYDGGLAKPSGD